MQSCGDFQDLTPPVVLNAVEEVLSCRLAPFTHAHNSYINRVYELERDDGTRIIVKFYRPGRWTFEALVDEHDFVLDCFEAEIPVVPPDDLGDGVTLGEVDGVYFAVFEKRRGREFEVIDDTGWQRLGQILGRMHVVGDEYEAEHRIVMHPRESTIRDIRQLREGGFVTGAGQNVFFDTADRILEYITPLFDDVHLQRIHGDCHCQNILERPEEGLMLIDFDDMVTGPTVQDMWMLLPGHAHECRREIHLILEGYEMFHEFDDHTLRLIEPLRAMRMLYFLAWCSRQLVDPNFTRKFPEWGTDSFWSRQANDLQQQLNLIQEHA
ncbi:MAG: serine/threonine protein kinase [Lentisphaeria bacterium]|nr:serine/threonine protein kinase [Lentisphaeria bacterium]